MAVRRAAPVADRYPDGAEGGSLVGEDDAIYVLLYEGRALSGSARQHMVRLRDRYDALWDGVLHEAAGTGQLRPELDLRLVRLFLLGGANWTAQWFSPRGAATVDDIADGFADLILRGLLAEPRERPALSLVPPAPIHPGTP